MKHPLPVVVGDGAAHAAAHQLQRLSLAENEGKEFVSIAQSARGAMVAIDHRHSAPTRQGRDDAGTEIKGKMIDVFPVDARMFEPPFQRLVVYEMRHMDSAELPRD